MGFSRAELVIYLYSDPKTSVPRYIGIGGKKRPMQHIKDGSCNPRLDTLIKKRMSEGYDMTPEVYQLGHCDAELAKLQEMAMICAYGRLDTKTGTLFNHTEGGDGTWGWRHKVGPRTGKPVSAETRAKIAKSNTGKPPTRGNTGQKHTVAAREKMSKSAKEYFSEHEHHWVGRTHSEETRKAMSMKRKAWWEARRAVL